MAKGTSSPSIAFRHHFPRTMISSSEMQSNLITLGAKLPTCSFVKQYHTAVNWSYKSRTKHASLPHLGNSPARDSAQFRHQVSYGSTTTTTDIAHHLTVYIRSCTAVEWLLDWPRRDSAEPTRFRGPTVLFQWFSSGRHIRYKTYAEMADLSASVVQLWSPRFKSQDYQLCTEDNDRHGAAVLEGTSFAPRHWYG